MYIMLLIYLFDSTNIVDNAHRNNAQNTFITVSFKGISFGYLKKIKVPQHILQAKFTIHGILLFSTFNFNCDITRFTRSY